MGRSVVGVACVSVAKRAWVTNRAQCARFVTDDPEPVDRIGGPPIRRQLRRVRTRRPGRRRSHRVVGDPPIGAPGMYGVPLPGGAEPYGVPGVGMAGSRSSGCRGDRATASRKYSPCSSRRRCSASSAPRSRWRGARRCPSPCSSWSKSAMASLTDAWARAGFASMPAASRAAISQVRRCRGEAGSSSSPVPERATAGRAGAGRRPAPDGVGASGGTCTAGIAQYGPR